jgi:hypothetical protein
MTLLREQTMKRFALIGLMPSLALAACSISQSSHRAGSARAAITGVPQSVACVQLVAAAAGNNITRGFDVTAGQDLVAQLDELPVGNVTITAFAFPSNCAGASTSHPNWASSPTFATILAGQVANISLTLEPVGDVSVGVHFDVDASVPPDMTVTPAQLVPTPTFWITQQYVGTSILQSFTITNSGGSPSDPLAPSITPASTPFFVDSTDCNRTLLPGDSCSVGVSFRPVGPGTFVATLSISDGRVAKSVTVEGIAIFR